MDTQSLVTQNSPSAFISEMNWLNLSPDLICLWSFEGFIQHLNPLWQTLLGWTPEVLQQQPYLNFVHPQDQEPTRAELAKILVGMERGEVENRFLTPTGSYKWLSWKIVPLGDRQLWYGIARDISTTKQVEATYCSLYENSLRGIFQSTPEGQYQSVNQTLAQMYGYESSQDLIETIRDIKHQIYVIPNRRDEFVRLLETHELGVSNFESEVYCKDGSIIWVSESAAAVRDETGQILYYEGFVENITERKQAELAKRNFERHLQQQQQALIQLAKCSPIYNGELELAWPVITETAARTLRIERASIWLYQSNGESRNRTFTQNLVCADLYEVSQDRHSAGFEIAAENYPNYFQALETGDAIAAYNAHTDPRTQEFSQDYLTPLGITSMLDVPIRLGNRTAGVLCLEHMGQPRQWLVENQNFASYLAYMASLAMEACDRTLAVQEAERSAAELEQSLSLLQATLESTTEGILATDLHGNILSYNRKFSQMWSFPDSLVNLNDYRSQLNQVINPEAFLVKIQDLYSHPDQEGYDVVELQDGRILEYSSIPQRIGKTIVGRVWSYTDITERQKIERLKNEFVSMVSHELRTPLTSIRGSLSLIVGGVVGEIPLQAKSLIEIAYKNSERLVLLINDILDIEKIESGKMDFNLQPIELIPLVENALEANRAYGQQFGVNFQLDSPGMQGIKVNADSDRLIQVLTNLLSNATKFSPRGETVVITVTVQSDPSNLQPYWVRVEVCDRGPGIPEDFRSKIFQKFAQADSSDTRQKGGTGLGLSISRLIIEKLGGQMGFETELNVGTTFYFTLPIWCPCTPSANSPSAEKSRILICEDDPDIALLLSLMLQQSGFATDIVYNAIQAKQILDQQSYGAMTVDLGLPDQDGLSLIRELRDREHLRDLPIIIVSAHTRQGQHQFNSSGFPVVDWLDKPIDRERLIATVQQAAQKQRHRQPRILHIEDDADVLQVVALILRDVAEIIPASNLHEAQQQLATQTFDLIILDIGLPDGSGLELLLQLQNQSPFPVPVAIFSAQDVAREVASKVAATLVKSRTSNQELVNTIKLLIEY